MLWQDWCHEDADDNKSKSDSERDSESQSERDNESQSGEEPEDAAKDPPRVIEVRCILRGARCSSLRHVFPSASACLFLCVSLSICLRQPLYLCVSQRLFTLTLTYTHYHYHLLL